jgi:hypothetical protein
MAPSRLLRRLRTRLAVVIIRPPEHCDYPETQALPRVPRILSTALPDDLIVTVTFRAGLVLVKPNLLERANTARHAGRCADTFSEHVLFTLSSWWCSAPVRRPRGPHRRISAELSGRGYRPAFTWRSRAGPARSTVEFLPFASTLGLPVGGSRQSRSRRINVTDRGPRFPD